MNLFVFDASGERRLLQVQFCGEVFECWPLTAIADNRQHCFRDLLLDQRKCPQHGINSVMSFEITIREKDRPQLISFAKDKLVELDEVEDRRCLETKAGEDSDQVL